MGVFDPRQGQVLPSPVTNFYKGKAIRQELADAEQISELRGLQIEDAKYEASPERRAKREEVLDLKLEAARTAVDQAEVELGASTMAYMAKTLAPVTSGATQLALSGDIEGGTEYFNKEIQRILPTLPETIRERVKKGAGADHVYDAEEIINTKLMLSQWGAKNDVKRTQAKFLLDGKAVQGSFDPYGNYYDANGNLATGKVQPIAPQATQGELTGDPRTQSQKGSEFALAKEEYEDSSDLREMISDFMPKAIELPEAIGGVAKLGQNLAAALSIVGQDAAADAVLENLTKTDQETIAAMQTQLTLIRSRVRPIATGDSGTRQSDSERRIANEVVQLTENLDSPSELLKNYPRAMGALKQLAVETFVRQYQVAKRNDGLDYPYDLSTDSGKREFLTELSNSGFDEASALAALARLESIQAGE